MELHSQTAASKMWYYLRAVLFMLKVKSVISKRKLIMDVNMFMKRGKLTGKSISSLLAVHRHNSHRSIKNPALSTNEYEFSCPDNSYNPHDDLYVQEKKGHNRRGGNYFACLSAPVEEGGGGGEEQEAEIRTPLRLEYASQDSRDLMTTALPFDGRASDFSAMLEREGSCSSGCGGVDTEAEEFIRRFYEQLKKQREVGLLEYPPSESGEISECCD